MTRSVVVAGGGITGLVAARTLSHRAPPGTRVILVEGDDRLGGKIRTHRVAGAPIEAGPDWFLTSDGVMTSLCRELRLEAQLVEPAVSGALIWSRSSLQPLPGGFIRGVPASVGALLRCPLLSLSGRLRALGDLVLPGPLRGPDVSVDSLVRRRFGPELLDRLVDPVVAASRSGAPDRMSLGAATRELDEAARGNRSVMRGLSASNARKGPGFRGLRDGMEALVDALAADLPGVEVRLGTTVLQVRKAGNRYGISTTGKDLEADALLLALPAPNAAATLRSLDSALATELDTIRYTSAAVVSLVYPPGTVAAPGGASGFLVPSDEGRLITACAWYSAKWGNARPEDGSIILRCFVGRAPDDPVLRLEDDDLVRRIAHEVSLATGATAPHTSSLVTRWTNALPLYEVGHLERVQRIDDAVAGHPGLEIAGAGYRGSGLPDCVAGGRAAAESLLSH